MWKLSTEQQKIVRIAVLNYRKMLERAERNSFLPEVQAANRKVIDQVTSIESIISVDVR